MRARIFRDRLAQCIGFLVLMGLTLALIFAFSKKLLPSQEGGDVFDTVYVWESDGEPSEASDEP